MWKSHSCCEPSRPGERNSFRTMGPHPSQPPASRAHPSWLLAPCGFWPTGSWQTAGRQRGRLGPSLSLSDLMVIGTISMHFHAGLCHKFTWLHTGLLPSRNAVVERGLKGLDWGVWGVVQVRPTLCYASAVRQPSSPLRGWLLPQPHMLWLDDFPWEGDLGICCQSRSDPLETLGNWEGTEGAEDFRGSCKSKDTHRTG